MYFADGQHTEVWLVSLLMGSTLRYGWSVGQFADGQHTEVWLVSWSVC